MITITNVCRVDGSRATISIPSHQTMDIDGRELLCLPGLIDPHVHFRTPGHEHKENWQTAALAALQGGFTCVFDMPNNDPACTTAERLQAKKTLIDSQLSQAEIPLNYHLYFGADSKHFDQIPLVKDQIIGIKVFMGSSTGDLLIADDSSLHAIFAIAAKLDLLVAIHGECDCLMNNNAKHFKGNADFKAHSLIRSPEVAATAVAKAINIAECYGTRLMVLHMSSANELELVRAAKAKGLPIYAETSPHHLFLDESVYETLQGKAQVNPPIREKHHRQALLEGVQDGSIDTIGSDHAPHTLKEKAQPYGSAPSGMPGIETTLPLLLNAYHQNRISLKQICDLTYHNINKIYRIPPRENDMVLVDLAQVQPVLDERIKSKCGWSAYHGWRLQGWPRYTIVGGYCHTVDSSVN